MKIPKKNPLSEPILPVQVFLTLFKTNVALVKRLEEQLATIGLTLGRLCLLYSLQRFNKPALPSELGDDLAVTRANISGLLNALEKLNLVRRELDPSDRRKVLVHLTQKGEDKLNQAWPLYEAAIKSNFSPLTEEEQLDLIRLLKKIHQ